jgi:hypothetical protein
MLDALSILMNGITYRNTLAGANYQDEIVLQQRMRRQDEIWKSVFASQKREMAESWWLIREKSNSPEFGPQAIIQASFGEQTILKTVPKSKRRLAISRFCRQTIT